MADDQKWHIEIILNWGASSYGLVLYSELVLVARNESIF